MKETHLFVPELSESQKKRTRSAIRVLLPSAAYTVILCIFTGLLFSPEMWILVIAGWIAAFSAILISIRDFPQWVS